MKMLANIQPAEVFEIFEEISRIPRGSGNEEAVSNFLANAGKCMGYNVYQDEAFNVVIKKPASEGYEDSPAVILQGHMDMVCEKNKGTEHDFLKDPIMAYAEGGYVKAEGTTLGADNGIAVAYMLALLKDKTLNHPPLEMVFTSDEEAGMNGARALDCSVLEGRRLINLDSEEEGHILTCCAGGLRASITIPVSWERPKSGQKAAKISIKGLAGGHSGADIHLQRANANKLMGRLVKFLRQNMEIWFAEIEGGNMDNAIPRESWATAVVNETDTGILKGLCEAFEKMCINEYRNTEKNIYVELMLEADMPKNVFSYVTAQKAEAALMLTPYGVKTMSTDIPGLVESSNNLGIVRTCDDGFKLTCAVRSSVGTRKSLICGELEEIAALTGGKFETHGEYPAWEYNPKSDLRDVMVSVYKEMFGKDAKIDAIHAGLECGLLGQKIEGIDMVSIGPDMENVHTPNEKLSIESVERTWRYIKKVLENLK